MISLNMQWKPLILLGVLAWSLSGCASSGYLREGRYINPGYEFSVLVPAGWGLDGEASKHLRKKVSNTVFGKLHLQEVLHNSDTDGHLFIFSGKSLFPYPFYMMSLFESSPDIVFADYAPNLDFEEEFAPMETLNSGGAMKVISIKEKWNEHFGRNRQEAEEKDSELHEYFFKPRYDSPKGYTEEYVISDGSDLHVVRQKTVFFICSDDQTCMVSLALASPPEHAKRDFQILPPIIDSLERLFPFEKPY